MKKVMTKTVEDTIKDWLKSPYDEETRREVSALINERPEEAKEAFTSHLHFGTGGVRAKMGPGPGRMNKYTVRFITQGLANYIKRFPKEQRQGGVVICHDSRIHARDFALESARVLAGNHIPVHLVRELRPTPFASFAVRHLHAIAGINITASHNPKEYNGYKVYWADGAQVLPPHDTGIMEEVAKITDPSQVHLSKEEDPLITLITQETDDAYLKAVYDLSIEPAYNREHGSTLSLIYSPLNGAGITMIPDALKMWGFNQVSVVEEQKKPDGNFPTTPYPNPETAEALALGLRDLAKKNADLLLVSDPDSDRLSCSLLYHGAPRRLSGNELGVLMLHYLIYYLKPQGSWATVTSIVSTRLIRALTEEHGGTTFEVLTGFKYIGEKIHEWEEKSGEYQFLFGMEESLGYLYGTHSRDKDATIAACLTAEMALRWKKEGNTLMDQLYDIYAHYGIYRDSQLSIESKEGMEHLMQIIAKIRKNPPTHLADQKVTCIEDYQISKAWSLETQKSWTLKLPPSNVLVFYLGDKSRFVLRPSGTEPKVKIYGEVIGEAKSIPEGIKRLDAKLQSMLESIRDAFFT